MVWRGLPGYRAQLFVRGKREMLEMGMGRMEGRLRVSEGKECGVEILGDEDDQENVVLNRVVEPTLPLFSSARENLRGEKSVFFSLLYFLFGRGRNSHLYIDIHSYQSL